MKSKRALLILYLVSALVVFCTAVSILERLVSSTLPAWSTCCHVWHMSSDPTVLAWLHLAARSTVALVLSFGVGRAARRIWRTYRFAREVKTGSRLPEGYLTQLCHDLDLEKQVLILTTPVPLAFCVGLFRPRICISTGLVEMLTSSELEAVLYHEAYHQRRFDPLRTLLVELLSTVLFFLPVVDEWRYRFGTSLELAADRYAADQTGRASLAGALHKLLTHASIPEHSPVSTPVGISATESRVLYLLGQSPPASPLTFQSIAHSSLLLLLACLVLQLALG